MELIIARRKEFTLQKKAQRVGYHERDQVGAYNVGSKDPVWHSRCLPGHHNAPLIDV